MIGCEGFGDEAFMVQMLEIVDLAVLGTVVAFGATMILRGNLMQALLVALLRPEKF